MCSARQRVWRIPIAVVLGSIAGVSSVTLDKFIVKWLQNASLVRDVVSGLNGHGSSVPALV